MIDHTEQRVERRESPGHHRRYPTAHAVRLAVLTLALVSPGAFAQRNAPVDVNPDPEIQRKSFLVADGFEVNLFAADPLLAKPIQMNFDAAGRLWIASSETYPQIKPGDKANDKVIVLEDTNGDGKADKTTVFADGLLIPTGIEPGDGGVYVANSTELLHLRDTTGDGKADQRRILLSGFGTEDTHHILHTLRWGPDGCLYMNQSIYIHSHIETPHGVRRLNGGGIWQYRPETHRLEVFMYGLVNPWGHHWDRWGQSFATDGAGGEGVNYVIPRGYYVTTPYPRKIFRGLNPGQPKFCGHEIVDGRHLPDDWQGNLITNDFRGHRVCRFKLSPDGAGYVAQQLPDLIRTNHPAFRPIDVRMGPDGAIYIADWFNPIIQHGEVDFRDPRRDKVHGRIWRVTAKGRPTLPRPKLVDAATEELLEHLKAPEAWTRHHARRLLKERGDSVKAALDTWTAKQQDEAVRLDALWTYQSLDTVEPKLLASLLEAKDARVRAAAVRVVGEWRDRLSDPLAVLAPRVTDAHPQVRLEAVRALGLLSGSRPVELALAALDLPTDRFLEYGLYLTVKEREDDWLAALKEGRFHLSDHPHRLLYALQAVGSPDVVRPMLDLLQGDKIPADRQDGVLATIATLGKPQDLQHMFERFVLPEAAAEDRRLAVLGALLGATRTRGVRPAGDLERVLKLLKEKSSALRLAALRAAGVWKIEAARPHFLASAKAATTAAEWRRVAVDGLVALGGPASRDTLEQLTQPEHPAPVRRGALSGLVALDPAAAARIAPEVLSLSGPPAEVSGVFDAFLQAKAGIAALAAALNGKTLPEDVARIGVRTARATGREVGPLVEALIGAGKLTFGARALTADELRRFVTEVAERGDPADGEIVFRHKAHACQKCHAIFGAGGQVGPDLSSLGASAPVDYLIESLLEPNKAVKENYHTVVVGTAAGKVYTGIKLRETKEELILRSADDQEIAIPKRDIEEQGTGRSLMPEGLADTMTRNELVSLVRFLSELGKVGPYGPNPARWVRRWQVSGPSDNRWEPIYATVAGEIPFQELPRSLGRLRFQVETSAAGPVILKWNSAKGLRLIQGEGSLPCTETMTLNLPAGVQTITILVDPRERDNVGLRCELLDAPGSPARPRPIGGK